MFCQSTSLKKGWALISSMLLSLLSGSQHHLKGKHTILVKTLLALFKTVNKNPIKHYWSNTRFSIVKLKMLLPLALVDQKENWRFACPNISQQLSYSFKTQCQITGTCSKVMTKWNFQFLINWTSIKHILRIPFNQVSCIVWNGHLRREDQSFSPVHNFFICFCNGKVKEMSITQ